MLKYLLSAVTLVAVCHGFKSLEMKSSNKQSPQLDQNEWWGPGHLKDKQDTTIRPFKIEFSDKVYDTRSKKPTAKSSTIYSAFKWNGFRIWFQYQRDGWLAGKYWAEEYPFKEREEFLNQFPQYMTNIQGLDIHFIRVKPEVSSDVEVVPILLMHGWPGSVREFYESIPLLAKQVPGYNFAFEVIVPSLPGYGYSDGAVRPGLGTAQMGVIFKNLMNRLGFEKFYVQGGDWGSVIGAAMATFYPDAILGYHTNMAPLQNLQAVYMMLLAEFIPSLVVDLREPNHMKSLYTYFQLIMEEYGYFHIQATKPDTIGVAFADSPSGLLAYILEKVGFFTREEHRYRPDGGITVKYTKDQVLDNLMFYWAPNSMTTAIRLYAEQWTQENRGLDIFSYPTPVPTWALQAKHEQFYQPPSILGIKYSNLLGNTVLNDGGHFLALELPNVFAEDVFKAVNVFRNFHHKNVHIRTEL